MNIDGEDAASARAHRDELAQLRAGSPDDWHRYAFDLNWDDPLDGLFWIVRQPQCDRATAHLIFWKGEPTGYEWERDDEPMGADEYAVAPMLRFIAERFNAHGFPRAEIAYDYLADHGCNMPEYHAMEKAARLRDIAELEQRQRDLDPQVRLHPLLKALTIPGRKVAWYEGEEPGEPIEPAPAPASSRPAPQPEPPAAGDAAPREQESAASARVRAVRRQSAEVPATPDQPSEGWLARIAKLFGR